jgi:hypothetical protein
LLVVLRPFIFGHEVDVHLPCDRLLPYVKQLLGSENEQENAYQVLPDTALVIGFQYRGKLSIGRAASKII